MKMTVRHSHICYTTSLVIASHSQGWQSIHTMPSGDIVATRMYEYDEYKNSIDENTQMSFIGAHLSSTFAFLAFLKFIN
jgi:hypothetical protein